MSSDISIIYSSCIKCRIDLTVEIHRTGKYKCHTSLCGMGLNLPRSLCVRLCLVLIFNFPLTPTPTPPGRPWPLLFVDAGGDDISVCLHFLFVQNEVIKRLKALSYLIIAVFHHKVQWNPINHTRGYQVHIAGCLCRLLTKKSKPGWMDCCGAGSVLLEGWTVIVM